VIVIYAAVGIGLLPWTIWIGTSLSAHHVTNEWDVAWSGFDTGLALLFISTAVAAYRNSPWVGALSAATGSLLVTDAWFDVILESHADERLYSIVLAIFGELPTAILCFWIAYRTERFLAKIVEEVAAEAPSHLAAAGQSPAEGDLIGVLEVASDGKPAREARDANAPP
jgi:hypothetical protein